MLIALVLVCSLAVTHDLGACNRDNAIDVLPLPEQFSNPATCAMEGQAYVAQTAIGQELTNGETVKVLCVPTSTEATLSR